VRAASRILREHHDCVGLSYRLPESEDRCQCRHSDRGDGFGPAAAGGRIVMRAFLLFNPSVHASPTASLPCPAPQQPHFNSPKQRSLFVCFVSFVVRPRVSSRRLAPVRLRVSCHVVKCPNRSAECVNMNSDNILKSCHIGTRNGFVRSISRPLAFSRIHSVPLSRSISGARDLVNKIGDLPLQFGPSTATRCIHSARRCLAKSDLPIPKQHMAWRSSVETQFDGPN
jgi:hypothetical protein